MARQRVAALDPTEPGDRRSGWATFQVLRRTTARLSRKLKIDDKVSADQRGHGRGVSMEVYSRSDLEQMLEAVTKLESEVIQ